MLRIKKVAETLGVSEDTVKRLVQRGDLVGYRIGKRLRFDVRDAEAYLNQSKTKG